MLLLLLLLLRFIFIFMPHKLNIYLIYQVLFPLSQIYDLSKSSTRGDITGTSYYSRYLLRYHALNLYLVLVK
jgi:hypothetical protein